MTNEERVLTADEVAQRLERAAMRTLRILMDIRQAPGLNEQVRASRHLVSLHELDAELGRWLGRSAGT